MVNKIIKIIINIIIIIVSISSIFGSIDFFAGWNDFNMTNVNINNKGIELTGQSKITFPYQNIIRTYYAKLFFNSIPEYATLLKGMVLVDSHHKDKQRTEITTEREILNVKFGESDKKGLDKIHKGLNEILVSSYGNTLFYKNKTYNLTDRNYLKENKFIIGNSHFKGYVEEMCLSNDYLESYNKINSDCFNFKLKRVTDNLRLFGTVEYKDTKFKLIGDSRIEFEAPTYNKSKELNILVDVTAKKDTNIFHYVNGIDFVVTSNNIKIDDNIIYFNGNRFLIKIKNKNEIEIYSGNQIRKDNNLNLQYKHSINKITLYGNNNTWKQFIIVNRNLTSDQTFKMLNNYDIDNILTINKEKNISIKKKKIKVIKKSLPKETKTNTINYIKPNIIKEKPNFEAKKKEGNSHWMILLLFTILVMGVLVMWFKPNWINNIIEEFR